MKQNFIDFSIMNKTGVIKLNRSNALNALNYDMVVNLIKILTKCNEDKNINNVLLYGEGKALCAGGDVKSLFLSSNKNNLKEIFFRKEYLLNNMINEFPKNYLSIWDGIVMGGGVGLSVYGNYRLVSDKAKFAMPETAIGFFPDVGGSFFLSRLGKGIGLYLGLTGKICNARDMMDLGLATHYMPTELIENGKKEYIENENIQKFDYYPDMSSDIIENKNFIEDVFQGTLVEVMKKLKVSKNKFGLNIYSHLLNRCPMSLAITLKLLNLGKSKTLRECLSMEFKVSQYMVYREDFNNGVDSVLISKNYETKWNPPTIEEINYEELKNIFEFDIKKLYL